MNDQTQLYEAETLMTGYRIGLRNPSLYIGVPKQYISGGGCFAKFQGQVRAFSMDKCVKEEHFNDKFKVGAKYTLCYFLWKRVSKGPIKVELPKLDKNSKEFLDEVKKQDEERAELVGGVKVDKKVLNHQLSLNEIEKGNI